MTGGKWLTMSFAVPCDCLGAPLHLSQVVNVCSTRPDARLILVNSTVLFGLFKKARLSLHYRGDNRRW
jgi:hypothetical protein